MLVEVPVYIVKHRRERRTLSRSGGATNEDDSILVRTHFLKSGGVMTQILKLRRCVLYVPKYNAGCRSLMEGIDAKAAHVFVFIRIVDLGVLFPVVEELCGDGGTYEFSYSSGI